MRLLLQILLKKQNQNQDLFEKPFYTDIFSANNCKSMEHELESVNSFLPYSNRTCE